MQMLFLIGPKLSPLIPFWSTFIVLINGAPGFPEGFMDVYSVRRLVLPFDFHVYFESYPSLPRELKTSELNTKQ